MPRVKALVITGYGTNCERESAHGARIAGADEVTIAYFSDLLVGRVRLPSFNFLIFPGGFLDGDDLGAGQAAALRWRFAASATGETLLSQLNAFLDAGGLILGICNGFQLLVKLGLLPQLGLARFERQATLMNNDSGRFEDRWVSLTVEKNSPCVFTRDIHGLPASRVIDLPIRHGEGKFIPKDQATLDAIEAANLVAFRYCDPVTGAPTQGYPQNPNGSPNAIAGLTDPTGRVLGLMPHPEAYNHPTNHPAWTRQPTATGPLGVEIIASGVRALKAGD